MFDYLIDIAEKQQEVYRNAKLIRKFRKSVKQQERREDCVPAISIPEVFLRFFYLLYILFFLLFDHIQKMTFSFLFQNLK